MIYLKIPYQSTKGLTFTSVNMAQALKHRLYRFYQTSTFYHVLFWVFMYIFVVLLTGSKDQLGLVMIKSAVNISLFIVMAYVNVNYLIPQLLSKGKTIIYVLSLVSVAIALTPIKLALFYIIYMNDPQSQSYFLDNYHLPLVELTLVGVASTIYKLFTDILYHQSRTRDLERQNLTSELKFLKTQIDPHFFFNTLNSLYALTLKKSDEAPDTVLKLSNMMRYMLYECNDKTVPLEKEIAYIKNYIDLESIRVPDRNVVNLSIEGDPENKQIMPLIFSPFIENSFKHGLSTVDSGFIDIKLKILEDHLFFNLSNSYQPSDRGKDKLGGIGLENVKRRLNLVYPDNHMLRIDKANSTYTIELYIKLINTNTYASL